MAKFFSSACYLLTVSSIDLLHATRQLYTPLRIDGIKVISRGIFGGKQVIKFANTRSRGRVCLFYQTLSSIKTI